MGKIVYKTSEEEKQKLEIQLRRYIFATNLRQTIQRGLFSTLSKIKIPSDYEFEKKKLFVGVD